MWREYEGRKDIFLLCLAAPKDFSFSIGLGLMVLELMNEGEKMEQHDWNGKTLQHGEICAALPSC